MVLKYKVRHHCVIIVLMQRFALPRTAAHTCIVLVCFYNLAADTRPLQPTQYPSACAVFDECPPEFERQLYLILRDKEIRDADPQSLLPEALMDSAVYRLQTAKTLTADSLYLKDVPVAARTRFIVLLDATPSEAGTSIIWRTFGIAVFEMLQGLNSACVARLSAQPHFHRQILPTPPQ
jgi:hypothetical protein